MRKKWIHILCCLLFCLGLFNSCKTSRTASVSGKVNTKALDEFVASMQEQELQFHTLSARLSTQGTCVKPAIAAARSRRSPAMS